MSKIHTSGVYFWASAINIEKHRKTTFYTINMDTILKPCNCYLSLLERKYTHGYKWKGILSQKIKRKKRNWKKKWVPWEGARHRCRHQKPWEICLWWSVSASSCRLQIVSAGPLLLLPSRTLFEMQTKWQIQNCWNDNCRSYCFSMYS